MKKIFFLIVFFVGIYFAGRILLVWNTPNSDSDARIDITISKGSSLTRISEQLAREGLIRDPFVFRLYVKWKGLTSSFQAGDYSIPQNLTFAEISELLQHGRSEEIRITIPEGYTIAQIDELLAKKTLIEPGEFEECTNFCDLGFRIASLEGYLFPSTYNVHFQNFSSKTFIQRLYNTFQQQIAPLRPEIEASGRSLNDIVIMASMIEREAFIDSEMPLISDVLWKRIDEGIPLGVDATTRYELNEWNRPLYTQDFESDTPYNTRRVRGFPPTAISNPGIKSLEAAVRPESNPYYYYLHAPDGQIYFGETHDDHVRNKELYLY
jgi:UPF0755 protein